MKIVIFKHMKLRPTHRKSSKSFVSYRDGKYYTKRWMRIFKVQYIPKKSGRFVNLKTS